MTRGSGESPHVLPAAKAALIGGMGRPTPVGTFWHRLTGGFLGAFAALALAASPVLALTKEEKRLYTCREVLEELLAGKESIPRDLLDKAECVAVVPGVKKDKNANKQI